MELRKLLESLKFNKYQKAIIEFLAETESADARTLTKRAGIPQGRIYSTLNNLITEGIVKISPTKPKTYKILNLKDSLQQYIVLQRDKLDEKIKSLDEIKLKPKTINYGKKPSSLTIFSGKEEHFQALIDLRNRAENELLASAPLFIGTFSSNLATKKALKRGVKLKVIIPKITKQNRQNIKETIIDGGEVRVLETNDMISMVIKDGSELLINLHDYHNEEERLYVCTKNKALIELMTNLHKDWWRKGETVTKNMLK